MSVEPTNIGIVKIGTVIKVPLTICNSNASLVAPDVSVLVTASYGITYKGSTLPKGTYDPDTNKWSVGQMGKGECIVAEFRFVVIDDRFPEFDINYTVNTTSGCPGCQNYSDCITLVGISCSQLQNCGDAATSTAIDDIVYCGQGVTCNGDVSTNDLPCPEGLTRTFKWIDTSISKGTIVGDPDDFTYTANGNFCGQSKALYGLYCNDVLVDTATVHFHVTCAAAMINGCCGCTIYVNESKTCSVSQNDLPCLFGARSSWHLVSNPEANGPVNEPTTSEDVTVTNWNQDTGQITLNSDNDFIGKIEVNYTIRCYDLEDNLIFETGSGIFVACVDFISPDYQPSYTPSYSPLYAQTYIPNYSPLYTPNYAPIYGPVYSPSYIPYSYTPSYIPNYVPVYTPVYTPNYTPLYIHTYIPSYTPT